MRESITISIESYATTNQHLPSLGRGKLRPPQGEGNQGQSQRKDNEKRVSIAIIMF